MEKLKYILSAFLLIFSLTALGQESVVMVLEIRDQIDPRMSRYVELALEEARSQHADMVIIDMDTYGGAVYDADKIRSMLMDFEKPVYSFINKDAASAGALISIACDSIYMASGASIGAATVVNGTDGQAMPDKYQSYMRSTMRSTAEDNGRDPRIAEAMVDESLEVEGISEAGKVLTFTASEAMAHGYCEATVNSISEIMERLGVEEYQVVKYEPSISEQVIAFFLNPMVSGILILVIMGGIYFELQSPGIGFPLAAAIIAALLYFTPYYLNGLAENWEIILFAVGILLLALEIFVIPGFGVAGILGIACMLGGLVLVMLNNDKFDFTFVSEGRIVEALTVTTAGFLFSIVGLVILGARLPYLSAFKRVALQETLSREEGYTSTSNIEDFVGRIGTAYTVLRPSGKIELNGEIKDAFTRGDYIEKGDKVEVIAQTGTSLKVRKLD
ncbi:NfeD family protein [Limibacter armeniacum]|uniref:NfeD family protein n=1 Tax=Limibacter armeniacum TaxID=466084 RepID=UPI002FE59026